MLEMSASRTSCQRLSLPPNAYTKTEKWLSPKLKVPYNSGLKQLNPLGARQAGMDATAYYITGQIDYTYVILLLDTGCSKSIIPTQLDQQLNQSCVSLLTPITGEGVLTDDNRLPIVGNTTLTLRKGCKAYTQSFLVANLQQHILLGLDYFYLA